MRAAAKATQVRIVKSGNRLTLKMWLLAASKVGG
jgi:hypothetical protein